MVKIYETAEDIEREAATQNARQDRAVQTNLLNTGVIETLYGGALLELDKMKRGQLKTAGKSISFWNKFERGLGITMTVVGLGSLGMSLLARSQARKAEARMQELGPEQVVLPPDMVMAQSADQPCTECRVKALMQHQTPQGRQQ